MKSELPKKKSPFTSSRRSFLKVGSALVAAGLADIRSLFAAAQGNSKAIDWLSLGGSLKGTVIPPSSERFELLRRALVWQLRKPNRYPTAIVQAESVLDVVKVVEFARKNHLQLAVRSGGHAYNASFLQKDVILLDIGKLREFDINIKERTITMQPAVRSVDLMAILSQYGLAFPAAHCGAVPMGGFLLGGGLGWNGEAWNKMSCFNVLEVEVVTADGEVIIANSEQNKDYYWAVRGAGPCFFGVVTSYKLALFENPGSVLTSTYVWPLSYAERACAWANRMAQALPANVELLFIMSEASEEVSVDCSPSRKVCSLQASAFASNEHDARKLLAPLSEQRGGLTSDCIMAEEFSSTPIADLYNWDATSYPQWRWAVDCLWTDDPPENIVAAIIDDITAMPSAKSSSLMLFKPRSVKLPEDAAFSMVGSTYFATYAIWGEASEDASNINWVDSIMRHAKPFTKGHYINESDFIAKPARVKASFSDQAWARLQSMIIKHDPNGVFYQVPSK